MSNKAYDLPEKAGRSKPCPLAIKKNKINKDQGYEAVMIMLFTNRIFQLWEYRVSHGSLLIRSPISPGYRTNVDIICIGVEYLAAPRFLRGLKILEPTAEELQQLEEVLGKPLSASLVRVLASSGQRFSIVAASFKLEENEHDIFESPFE